MSQGGCDKRLEFYPGTGQSFLKPFSGMLSRCDCPGGSSGTLNEGGVFIFSVVRGQSPWSNFPAGFSSGSQKAVEIDQILAFQGFREQGFHQFQSLGWRRSAERVTRAGGRGLHQCVPPPDDLF